MTHLSRAYSPQERILTGLLNPFFLPLLRPPACDGLQDRIVRFVTDPYTGSLLRERAADCVVAYRARAAGQRDSSRPSATAAPLALAYNRFVRAWRADLVQRGLLVGDGDRVVDPRLRFWRETIVQGWFFDGGMALIIPCPAPTVASSGTPASFLRKAVASVCRDALSLLCIIQ